VGVRPGGVHPVLGPTDAICDAGFEPITAVGRIDWRDPDRIPPVLEPARLPPGAGTALINAIAEEASGPLRYRGPYPTAALYRSLKLSFHPSAPVEVFTAGVEAAAVEGRQVEPAVEFAPAPFARFRTGEVTVEVKDEVVVSIYIGAARFERGRAVGRRISPVLSGRGSEMVAEFAVPGRPPIELAVADASGRVLSAAPAVAPVAGAHLGESLPDAVNRAVVATAAASAPALLRPALAALAGRPMVWGDTGLELAAIDGDRIAVHGDLATADLEPAALLATLVEAAVPVALRLAQRELSRLPRKGAAS
jgi:hypothetical protein